jgi:cyclin-dependent kinase 9
MRLLLGNSEQHQLELISHLCGSIEPNVWPGVNKLPLYSRLKLPLNERRKVQDRMKPYIQEPLALDLIDKLLTLDPKQRIDADNAVSSDFFYSEPPLGDLKSLLSKYPSMFELKEVSKTNYNQQMQQQQQQQQRLKQPRPNVPNLPSETIY